jgi:hypothetical protein
MSSIEERLARDIAAVTGGVVMTESDLRDARDAVDRRIAGQRQQGRRTALIAAAAAAVVIPVLGVVAFQTIGGDDRTAPPAEPAPSPSDPDADFLTGAAPSREVLEGVWRLDNGTTVLRFGTDGTVAIDGRGMLFADSVVGTYTIAEDVVTVDVQSGPAGCVAPQQLAMRASQPEAGQLHVVHAEPVTGGCLTDLQERWVLEQILPTSAGWAAADFSGDDFQPVAGASALLGDWLAQGGGHVLELATSAGEPDGGAYYVAAAAGDVVDEGRWTFDASRSQLRLVSSGSSPTCAEGDRLVIGGLVLADPGVSGAFRGTVTENTCAGAWTPPAWIQLPHQGS